MFTVLRNPVDRAISAYSFLRQESLRQDGNRVQTPSISAARDDAVSLAGRHG